MSNFRAKFTKWYYRKGYRMEYDACDYGDGVAKMAFNCPFWVKPLTSMYFSPSAYYAEYLKDNRNTIFNVDVEVEPMEPILDDVLNDEDPDADEDDTDDYEDFI